MLKTKKRRYIPSLTLTEAEAIQSKLLATGYHKIAEQHGISLTTADRLRNLALKDV